MAPRGHHSGEISEHGECTAQVHPRDGYGCSNALVAEVGGEGLPAHEYRNLNVIAKRRILKRNRESLRGPSIDLNASNSSLDSSLVRYANVEGSSPSLVGE